jgi:hypothetical protein
VTGKEKPSAVGQVLLPESLTSGKVTPAEPGERVQQIVNEIDPTKRDIPGKASDANRCSPNERRDAV